MKRRHVDMIIYSCHSDYSEYDCVLWIGLFVQLAISLGYNPTMDLILIILIIVMSTVSFYRRPLLD